MEADLGTGKLPKNDGRNITHKLDHGVSSVCDQLTATYAHKLTPNQLAEKMHTHLMTFNMR